MMRMDCEAVRDHIDAWALGALDADEARALESHIAGCAACQPLADDARETAASLAYAVPLAASSSALKSRTLASAAVLSDVARSRASRLWPLAAAALFVGGLGAFTWGAVMQDRAGDLETANARMTSDATSQSLEVAGLRTQVVGASASVERALNSVDTQSTVIDIVLQSDVVSYNLAGSPSAPSASARCVWSRGTSTGALVARNLPPPADGYSYHMWIVYEREWVSAGAFDVDDEGRGYLVMKKIWQERPDAGSFEGFAVTMEATDTPAVQSEAVVLRSVP